MYGGPGQFAPYMSGGPPGAPVGSLPFPNMPPSSVRGGPGPAPAPQQQPQMGPPLPAPNHSVPNQPMLGQPMPGIQPPLGQPAPQPTDFQQMPPNR